MTSLRLSVGGHTDVGQQREINQDSILLGPTVYGVADGMGGHQGGEIASAMAIESITGQLADTDLPTVDDLRDAVVRANEQLYERSGSDPTVAGMGTTLVAISLIRDEVDGVRVGIVNVGDSRAYRLVGGELTQITNDHSLVGELVRDGRITREEADVHPQRNIVTRALGIEPHVIVDDFQILPADGDRYILCSDGLTNEVPEAEIASVLRRITDPDAAAAELVGMANENGGRDNITVVIVDVHGGADATAATAASTSGVVPDAQDFSHHPGGDTDSYDPVHVDDEADTGSGDVPPATLARATDDTEAGRRGRRRNRKERDKPRAVTLRSIGFVLVVLAVFAGGGYLINDYATNTFHVTIADDEVVIMKGRPGGFWWFNASQIETTGIDADDVLPADRDDLVDGVSQGSLAAARRYVSNLRERIAETTPPVKTTTTTTSSSTTVPTSPTTVQSGGG